MKLKLYFLIVLTFGCRQPNKEVSTKHDNLLSKKDSLVTRIDSIEKILAGGHSDYLSWPDSLINEYVNYSKNKSVRLSYENKIFEDWVFDKIIKTDTAKYFVFQIGHDVTDAGETNKRFVTDGWIYIDSLANTIYEYDISQDRLTKWKK